MINLEGNNRDAFYNKDWFMWLTLILFAPLGIFLLWKRHRFGPVARVVISFIFAIMFLLPFGLTGRGTNRNSSYEQTQFSRVSWSANPLFSFRTWLYDLFTGRLFSQTTPTPAPTVQPWASPFASPSIKLPTTLPGQSPAMPTIIPGQSPAAVPPATTPRTVPTPAPAVTVPPSPATQPAGSSWKALQDKIFELTNGERQKNGITPLTYNAAVEKYAVAKSQDMVTNNYFDHKSPTNGYFYDIWNRDGFKYSSGAENIYTMTDTRGFANRDVNSLASTIVTGWMNSEGHRRNILNPNLKELGVGVASNSSKLDATQLFHTP